MQEAELEKQLLEAKKREKEELKDKAPIIDDKSTPVMVDPAPVLAVDLPKIKSEEGLSGKDIEVIEDALEKLGKNGKMPFGFEAKAGQYFFNINKNRFL